MPRQRHFRRRNGSSLGQQRRVRLRQATAILPAERLYVGARRAKRFVEATYQIQVAPWWQVQPDFQYIFNPGAGIVNPNDPAQRVKNELVVGLRTNITF